MLAPFLQELHEEWSYDITLFIADFGGSMGFLLGVSILSVVEIVEGILISICQLIRQRKEDKTLKKQQQQQQLAVDSKLQEAEESRTTATEK